MSGQKFVGFDIEIHKPIPEDVSDWKSIRPLGITCAGTWRSDEPYGRAWYAGRDNIVNRDTLVYIGDMMNVGSPPIKDKMTQEELGRLVRYLYRCDRDGYKIVTWNGLQFDFDVLAEESDETAMCVYLAMEHIDIMWQFFCLQGYPVGLKYVSQVMLGETKTEGMSGDLAPEMWQGTLEDRLKTIEYVLQDAKLTLELALAIEERKSLGWVTKQGKGKQKWIPFDHLLSCGEAMELPPPNVSWMDSPIPREQFYQWMKGVKE